MPTYHCKKCPRIIEDEKRNTPPFCCGEIMTENKTEPPTSTPTNYMDILSGECRALAERFQLSGDQSDTLHRFVTDTAMRSWRNGRATGYVHAKKELEGGMGNPDD